MSYAIIVGGGKIGYYLARSLINRDYEVCLMEKDPVNARKLSADLGDVVMQADGCDPLVLKSAGVARADLLFAATGDDPDNLVVCQIAGCCFHRTRIIARVNNPDNETLFEKLGIHERVSGTAAVLRMISEKVGKSPVILLGALEKSSLEVVEIMVEDDSPFCGAKLSEMHLPPKCLVISSLRNGQAQIPTGDTTFESGDVMVILVPAELESTLREFLV
ncbi:trk system potassium uptake protein TrkA [Abditibacterium utsteinense]|uniref:Trk system potassium uptake protein TrkA n=1 Tax=Abditibacterium utsteinense TaxID=1960156 RepID=A0A2S8SUV7_9BACT|nr:NAD-binding protein [Abditibacterium utsteinense]PQV64571.1 trk system potassium uptake protein TrkA [Abditibacterium utsteinense]